MPGWLPTECGVRGQGSVPTGRVGEGSALIGISATTPGLWRLGEAKSGLEGVEDRPPHATSHGSREERGIPTRLPHCGAEAAREAFPSTLRSLRGMYACIYVCMYVCVFPYGINLCFHLLWEQIFILKRPHSSA